MRRRPGVIATGPPSFVSGPANRSEMNGLPGYTSRFDPAQSSVPEVLLTKVAASLILKAVDRHYPIAEQLELL